MRPNDLIATARRLVGVSGRKRPRQSDLKRAVSTAYYALFHALCWTSADCLIGSKGSDRSDPAWRQVYRAVDHGFSKGQFRNPAVMTKFPTAVQDFGNLFIALQEERHRADYDPGHRCLRADVILSIDAAERTLSGLLAAPVKDRRALAAWVLLRVR